MRNKKLDHGAKKLEEVTTDKQKKLLSKLGFKAVKLQKLGIELYGKLCPMCREAVHLNPYQPEICPRCQIDNEKILNDMRKLAEEASK